MGKEHNAFQKAASVFIDLIWSGRLLNCMVPKYSKVDS